MYPQVISVKCSKIFLKYIELSSPYKNFQRSQFLSDSEPSEKYITLSFLYKFQTWEAYISHNIDFFTYFLSENAWDG